MESMAADEDFEPNQDSSFSEDELLPPRNSSTSEKSSTPGRHPRDHTNLCRAQGVQHVNGWNVLLCFSSSAVRVGQGLSGGRTQSADPDGRPASLRRTREHSTLP